MNRWLIQRWNEVVERESDIVWVLGDFGFPESRGPDAGEDLEVIFHKLRGIKNIVVGNHDEKNKTKVLRLPWENARKAVDGGTFLPHVVTFRDHERRVELCHYPMTTWKNAHKGALMFHGHSHNSLREKLNHRFDVGVDTPMAAGAPIPFDLLWETAQKQVFKAVDHHAQKEM
jgi:calcineurin-like phosphoesterase family protein